MEEMKLILSKLLELEWSMDTPLSRRRGQKACPWCAEYGLHDPLCGLNEAIKSLMAAKNADHPKYPRAIALAKQAISEVYRLPYQICVREGLVKGE